MASVEASATASSGTSPTMKNPVGLECPPSMRLGYLAASTCKRGMLQRVILAGRAHQWQIQDGSQCDSPGAGSRRISRNGAINGISSHYTLRVSRAIQLEEAQMPGAQMPLAADLLQRLQEEQIIWFTTVSPRNVPTPNPVWFLWDGECIVVYSQPESFRVRNIQKNPQVALTLQGVDGLGNHVCIINGEAEVRRGNRIIPPEYWKKYGRLLQDMSPDEMTASYSVEIRVRPRRIRTE